LGDVTKSFNPTDRKTTIFAYSYKNNISETTTPAKLVEKLGINEKSIYRISAKEVKQWVCGMGVLGKELVPDCGEDSEKHPLDTTEVAYIRVPLRVWLQRGLCHRFKKVYIVSLESSIVSDTYGTFDDRTPHCL